MYIPVFLYLSQSAWAGAAVTRYHRPGVLNTGGIAVNETDMVFTLKEHTLKGWQNINKPARKYPEVGSYAVMMSVSGSQGVGAAWQLL